MNTDCDIIRDTSIEVKNWIEDQAAVKEESITDWMLYTISKKIPRITYRAFSRSEEARITGADWEWWFVYTNYAFKLRVQAKKLFPGKDNYSGIARTNQHGLQIDKLLADALLNNYAPFYAFYTAEHGNTLCKKNINNEGVYIAGARNVYNSFVRIGKKQVSPLDALNISVALSCFFCCPIVANYSDRPIRFLREYFAEEIIKDPDATIEGFSDEDLLGFHSDLPNYVSTILEYQESFPDWWEKEFNNHIQGINAILIYDGREQENKMKNKKD